MGLIATTARGVLWAWTMLTFESETVSKTNTSPVTLLVEAVEEALEEMEGRDVVEEGGGG